MTAYSEIMRDYAEFVDAILLFRCVRDMDLPDSPAPGTWLQDHLDSVANQENGDYWTPEVKEYLCLAYKIADLIDDRKQWLIDEIEADLRKVQRPAVNEAA